MGGGPGGAADAEEPLVVGGKPNNGGAGCCGPGVVDAEPPDPGTGGREAGGFWYWKTFFRPISSFEPSAFSIRSSRIRASVGAGGFAEVFVSGTCTAAVVGGWFMRYPNTAVMT